MLILSLISENICCCYPLLTLVYFEYSITVVTLPSQLLFKEGSNDIMMDGDTGVSLERLEANVKLCMDLLGSCLFQTPMTKGPTSLDCSRPSLDYQGFYSQ